MTELNKESTIPENDNESLSPAKPGIMFITILLLISGLLLASTMLIHYGLAGTDENGEPISGLTHVIAMLKSKPAPKQTDSGALAPKQEIRSAESSTNTQETGSAPAGFSLKGLFSKNGSGTVHWPRLKLDGFGLPAKGEEGFAIINGKHVGKGGTINDVVLIEILAQGVVVEYKGETKTLIVEMTN